MTMETIKIDGELIRVDDLSDIMQNMVILFEYVAEQEAEARKQLAMCEAGRMELTRRMVATYQHEQMQLEKTEAEVDDSADAANNTDTQPTDDTNDTTEKTNED